MLISGTALQTDNLVYYLWLGPPLSCVNLASTWCQLWNECFQAYLVLAYWQKVKEVRKPGNEVSFDIIYAFNHLLKDLEKDFVQNTKHFVNMGWSRHKISLVRSTSCAFLSLLYMQFFICIFGRACLGNWSSMQLTMRLETCYGCSWHQLVGTDDK